MSVQIEDLGFKYSGYWKGTAAEVIEGDGVRFDENTPCVVVRDVGSGQGGEVVLLVEDRSAAVASIFADAFKRPIEGMSADPQPAMHSLAPTQPVWIRL